VDTGCGLGLLQDTDKRLFETVMVAFSFSGIIMNPTLYADPC